MIVTAWKSGIHNTSGNGYGFKVNARDRDRYFHTEWIHVQLELEGYEHPIVINIQKASFWNETCRELISKEIGKWLIKNGKVPWAKGKPPKLVLEPVAGNRFSVRF